MPQSQTCRESFESFAAPAATRAPIVLMVDAGPRRRWWRRFGATLPAAIHQAFKEVRLGGRVQMLGIPARPMEALVTGFDG